MGYEVGNHYPIEAKQIAAFGIVLTDDPHRISLAMEWLNASMKQGYPPAFTQLGWIHLMDYLDTQLIWW